VIERAEMVTPRLPVRALNFYPDIRLLRSTWRGLETESRLGLHGHERGNPGYKTRPEPHGPPRQPSTLPGVLQQRPGGGLPGLRVLDEARGLGHAPSSS
jgi:hypothetical protein